MATFVGRLGGAESFTPFALDSPINRNVDCVLFPNCRGGIGVMDNLASHKRHATESRRPVRTCRLLARLQSDGNAFAKLEARLRKD